MALQKSINLENYGIELPNSYHKIDSIRIENGKIDFLIKIYASKEARDSGAEPLKFTPMSVDYTEANTFAGDDLIAKLYTYVKTVNSDYSADTVDV